MYVDGAPPHSSVLVFILVRLRRMLLARHCLQACVRPGSVALRFAPVSSTIPFTYLQYVPLLPVSNNTLIE